MAEPVSVTIVMTVRETYSLTLQTIRDLFRRTTRTPFRLIFVNYRVPDEILAEIRGLPSVEVVDSDSPYPSVSMYRCIPLLQTKYTVFLDNDLLFEDGWLENLVSCLETSGAGIAGPAYLWKTDKIHMYGGDIRVEPIYAKARRPFMMGSPETAAITGRRFEERHHLVDKPRTLLRTLKPRKCDFVEFHCLVIRTELLRRGVLDPALCVVHQHIDLSLRARQLGYDTWTTPDSVVTYVNDKPLQKGEREFFLARWDPAAAERDIRHFCNKWGVADGSGFDSVRAFLARHVSGI